MAYVNKVKANKATTIPDVGEHDSLLSCWTNLNTHRKGIKTSSNCVSKQKETDSRRRRTRERDSRETKANKTAHMPFNCDGQQHFGGTGPN